MKSTLFTEEHKEIQSDSFFALQNDSLLRVHLKEEREVIARRGSVVALQGDIRFARWERPEQESHQSVPLLRATGEGDVFIAHEAAHIHILLLEDEGITVNGGHALAFDSKLRHDVKHTEIPALREGGFWNVHLTGTGSLALLSKGVPVLLRTNGHQTRTDLHSTIAWSSNLTPVLKQSQNLSAQEAEDRFYYSFSGDGWVIVQPGE